MNKLWILVLLLAAAAAGPVGAEPVQIDGVAAWVNGKPITILEVLREVQPRYAALARDKSLTRAELESRRPALVRQVLNSLVESELIMAFYEKEKQGNIAALTDQMINAQIEDIVREDYDGSREKLLKALAEDRLTFEDWRSRMSRRFIVQAMRGREVLSKIQVTPQQVRHGYETNRESFTQPGKVYLRRIVLKGPSAEARSLEAQDLLAAGESFESAAKSFGDASGGLWGWQAEADLADTLREKLAIMRLGGVCRLELGGDWYLVKLVGRDRIPFDEAAGGIEDNLRRMEAERLTRLWMNKLKRDFHVTIIPQKGWEG